MHSNAHSSVLRSEVVTKKLSKAHSRAREGKSEKLVRCSIAQLCEPPFVFSFFTFLSLLNVSIFPFNFVGVFFSFHINSLDSGSHIPSTRPPPRRTRWMSAASKVGRRDLCLFSVSSPFLLFTYCFLLPLSFHFPSCPFTHFHSVPFSSLQFPSFPFTFLHFPSLSFTSLPVPLFPFMSLQSKRS